VNQEHEFIYDSDDEEAPAIVGEMKVHHVTADNNVAIVSFML